MEELPGIKTDFAIFPERKAIVTYDPASVAIKESGERYDAVILDLTNNVGMGGVEAIKKFINFLQVPLC